MSANENFGFFLIVSRKFDREMGKDGADCVSISVILSSPTFWFIF